MHQTVKVISNSSSLDKGYGNAQTAFNFIHIQVGLLSAVTGVSDAIASFVLCKIASRFGRKTTMWIGFCVDIGYYTLCLFWTPTESSAWIVYLIFIGVGLSDGTWQPWVNGERSCMIGAGRA